LRREAANGILCALAAYAPSSEKLDTIIEMVATLHRRMSGFTFLRQARFFIAAISQAGRDACLVHWPTSLFFVDGSFVDERAIEKLRRGRRRFEER